MNQIKTTENWHPNTSIDFDANGIWLRVSLNVEAKVAKLLSPNNIQKGKYRIVYNLKMHVPTDMVCANTMRTTQKLLLNNCMKNIRKAKAKLFSINN